MASLTSASVGTLPSAAMVAPREIWSHARRLRASGRERERERDDRRVGESWWASPIYKEKETVPKKYPRKNKKGKLFWAGLRRHGRLCLGSSLMVHLRHIADGPVFSWEQIITEMLCDDHSLGTLVQRMPRSVGCRARILARVELPRHLLYLNS